MNRPTIVVSPYRARVVRRRHASNPNAEPRVRVRWRASFETFDEALDAVARLFGTGRTPDVTLGRALRNAARNPHRKNPGCVVELIDPTPEPEGAKGGAA